MYSNRDYGNWQWHTVNFPRHCRPLRGHTSFNVGCYSDIPGKVSTSFSTVAVFEEPEDPTNRSFFSEIISSISDVKFSHNGRYMMTRDYLSVKVWDLAMESRPVETYQVHEYLRSKLCSLYENDCIFDKFECSWSGDDRWGGLSIHTDICCWQQFIRA